MQSRETRDGFNLERQHFVRLNLGADSAFCGGAIFASGFHEIHRECGTRVHQQLYCPHDERVVPRDEVVMGYESEKDKYLIVDPAELKALQPKSSSEMDIVQFVKLSEVDPIYYETSYFAVATEAGAKAYGLLLQTMEQAQFAAIAQVDDASARAHRGDSAL